MRQAMHCCRNHRRLAEREHIESSPGFFAREGSPPRDNLEVYRHGRSYNGIALQVQKYGNESRTPQLAI